MNNKSFTIIELIIAIFIILTALVAGISLIAGTMSNVSLYKSKLIAAYLSQEGIEIVRNIRDTNWVKGETWDIGLTSGDWQANYTTKSFSADCGIQPQYNCRGYNGDFLKISAGNPNYNYTDGADTLFRREIKIEPEGSDILKVTAIVRWDDRGKTYSFTAQEKLYKWR